MSAIFPAASANWPPRFDFGEGWALTPSASWQYEVLDTDGRDGDFDIHGFRRQRTALTLEAPNGFTARADYDFTAGTWADVFVRKDLGQGHTVRIGQIKTPMGLEVLTSHRALSHFERSPVATLVPGRRLGLEWARSANNGTLTIAAIGDNVDQLAMGYGLFGRTTRAFGTDAEHSRFHVGFSAGVEWPDHSQRFRARPDVSGLPLAIADSGAFGDVDRLLRAGIEGAWDRGPVSVQAEHARLRGRRDDDDSDIDGHAGYLAATWRPTGEARRYKNGIFDTLQPNGRHGALELVARVSWLSVDAQNDTRQSGRSYSVGANWYFTGLLKLMAQVAQGDADDSQADDERVYGLRLHYLF